MGTWPDNCDEQIIYNCRGKFLSESWRAPLVVLSDKQPAALHCPFRHIHVLSVTTSTATRFCNHDDRGLLLFSNESTEHFKVLVHAKLDAHPSSGVRPNLRHIFFGAIRHP